MEDSLLVSGSVFRERMDSVVVFFCRRSAGGSVAGLVG